MNFLDFVECVQCKLEDKLVDEQSNRIVSSVQFERLRRLVSQSGEKEVRTLRHADVRIRPAPLDPFVHPSRYPGRSHPLHNVQGKRASLQGIQDRSISNRSSLIRITPV